MSSVLKGTVGGGGTLNHLPLLFCKSVYSWVVDLTNMPLKTLLGLCFRVKKNLQKNVLLISNLIFDLTKILLSKCLVLTYSLIAKVMHYQILFTELKSSY